MKKLYLAGACMLALGVGLFFSHTFAYQSGSNAVIAEYQAQALDQVADVETKQEKVAALDSTRYEQLDKAHKSLQSAYGKLLKEAKSKAAPDDAKYAVCTLDTDTLELLKASASGGLYQRISASDGSRFDGTLHRLATTRNGNPPRADRAIYRKRPAVLHQPVFAPFSYRGSAGSSGSAVRS